MAIVRIPTPFMKLTENKATIEVEGNTILEVIENIEKKYPGIKQRILKDERVNRYINIYVDEEDIRFKEGLETSLKDDSEVAIIPAISGGR